MLSLTAFYEYEHSRRTEALKVPWEAFDGSKKLPQKVVIRVCRILDVFGWICRIF